MTEEKSLDELRKEAIQEAIGRVINADDKAQATSARHSQYYRLLEAMTRSALQYAESTGMDADTFKYGGPSETTGVLPASIEVVEELRGALVPFEQKETTQSLDVWSRDPQPLERVRAKKTPYMHREEIERAVGSYLALPFRSEPLDRLLVDVLYSLEMYGFAHEMLNVEPVFWWMPTSPFKQRHALKLYLISLVTEAVVFLGLALASLFAGSKGLFSDGWAWGIAAIFTILFLVAAGWSTFVLPFQWHEQHKAKHKAAELMAAMFTLYPELGSHGPISARHIRERVGDIAKMGVIWPAPLFALLDDVILRSGRL